MLKECVKSEQARVFVFCISVGVYVVRHLVQFFSSPSLLDLLLVGGSKWFQWVQLVSQFSAVTVLFWPVCFLNVELSQTFIYFLTRSVYNRSGEWRDETIPILASTTVGFSYITFLLVCTNVTVLSYWDKWLYLSKSSLCFFSDFSTFPYILGAAAEPLLGSQGGVIYIWNWGNEFDSHTLWKQSSSLCIIWSLQIGVLATLLTTVSGVVSVDDIWGDEWDILLVSLQVGLESKWHDCVILYDCCMNSFCFRVTKTTLPTEKNTSNLLKTKLPMKIHINPSKNKLIYSQSILQSCGLLSFSLTTSVHLYFFTSPQHLSCTLERWQQSQLSAGWWLDMWSAEREPVSVGTVCAFHVFFIKIIVLISY